MTLTLEQLCAGLAKTDYSLRYQTCNFENEQPRYLKLSSGLAGEPWRSEANYGLLPPSSDIELMARIDVKRGDHQLT